MNERLDEIERRLEALSVRLAAVEGGLPPAAADPRDPPPLALPSFAEVPLLAGRSSLVLAGAYLLRSLTAVQYWPRSVGAVAGCVYAAALWLAADRARAAGRRSSAAVHAWCGALVVFPLLWETTGSMQALSPGAGAALWAAFGLAGTVIGWRHRGPAVMAATVALGFTTGTLMLLRGTAPTLLVAALLLIALVDLHRAQEDSARALLWTPTWLLCAAVVLLSAIGLERQAPDWLAPPALATMQWMVIAAFLGWQLSQMRRRRLLTSAGGAVFMALSLIAILGTRLPWPPGAPQVGEAEAAAVAVAAVGWMLGHRATAPARVLLNGAALALFLGASGAALAAGPRALLWGGLVLLCAILAPRDPTLAWAAAVIAAALATATGLLAQGVGAAPPALSLLPAALGAEAVLIAACVILTARRPHPTAAAAVPRMALLALATVGAAGVGLALVPAAHIPLPTIVALLVLALPGPARAETAPVGLGAVVAAGLQVMARDLVFGLPGDQFLGFATLGLGILGATLIRRRQSA